MRGSIDTAPPLEYRGPDPRRSDVNRRVIRWWVVVAAAISPFGYAMASALGAIQSRWVLLKIARSVFMVMFIAWPLFALNVVVIAAYLFAVRRTDVLGGRLAAVAIPLSITGVLYLIFRIDPLGLIDR